MIIYIVLHGCAAKPELSDELIGFFPFDYEAEKYCRVANATAAEGYSFWYEEVKQLKC